MTPTNAFVTIDEIVFGWLHRRAKTIHSYYKILSLAADAVREMALSSMPMAKTRRLTRVTGQPWYYLPSDYTGWLSVGLRFGDRWLPVGVTEGLMRAPSPGATGLPDDSDNITSAWTSWSIHDAAAGGPFMLPGDWQETWHTPNGGYYTNQVNINAAAGVVMVPETFPDTELYLVYSAVGKADTMTLIPIEAKAAIEAHIDWRYQANKRRGENVNSLRSMYHHEHKLYRARKTKLTVEDIRQILDRGAIGTLLRSNGIGSGASCGSGGAPTPPTPSLPMTLVLTGITGNVAINTALTGRVIAFLVINGIYKTSGYVLVDDTLTFTDSTTLTPADILIINFA